MKKISKLILSGAAVLSVAFLIYYYTDIFYPKTNIVTTEKKSEVLISRLTTKAELETIKSKLSEKGIILNIESVSFVDNRIQDITVNLITPFGAEGRYSSENMRFTRYFSILVDNTSSLLHIGGFFNK